MAYTSTPKAFGNSVQVLSCYFKFVHGWVAQSGNTRGRKYHCTIDLLFYWFGISCKTTDNFYFYLQNRPIQTSQTGGQWYSDTSPFSIPWLDALATMPSPLAFTVYLRQIKLTAKPLNVLDQKLQNM